MFEDIQTEPSIEDLQKRIEELEQENQDLHVENHHHRKIQAEDLETIEGFVEIVKRCSDKFGQDKVDKIVEEYKQEQKKNDKPDVGVTSVHGDDDDN